MAESVAVVSLVATIVQLIDFGSKVISRLKDFKSAAKEVPACFRAVRARLPIVLGAVEKIKEQAENSLLRIIDAEDLDELLQLFVEDVKYLERVISKNVPSATSSTLERRLMALKSLARDGDVKKTVARLDGYIHTLTMMQATIGVDVGHKLLVLRESIPLQNQPLQALPSPETPQISCPISRPTLPQNEARPMRNLKLRSNIRAKRETLLAQRLCARLMAKPSVLKDVSDEITNRENQTIDSNSSTSSVFVGWIDKYCACRPRVIKNSQTDPSRILNIFSKTLSSHREDCPLFNQGSVTHQYGLGIFKVSDIIGQALQATFALNFGAGGLSMSQNLNLRGFSRKNSPAFAVLGEFLCPLGKIDSNYRKAFSQMSARLRLLFGSGQASPSEKDEVGYTIVHVSFRSDQERWKEHELINQKMATLLINFQSNRTKRRDPSFAAAKYAFFSDLLDLGVPMNEIGVTETSCSTFLDELSWENCMLAPGAEANFIGDMVNRGCEFNEDSWLDKWISKFDRSIYGFDRDVQSPVCSPRRIISLMKACPEFAEACHCSSLSFAVLSREERSLHQIVQRMPCSIYLTNTFGHTALHIASDWPQGVKALLDHGAKVSKTDHAGILPLSYACFFGCYEVIELLLAADSPLSSPERPYTVLDDVSMLGNLKAFTLIARALAKRRKDLLELARQILPAHHVDTLHQLPLGHLDTEANRVLDLLADVGLKLDPHYFSYSSRGIYQTENLVPETADILHGLGFRNLQSKDSRAFEPSMSIIDGRLSHMKMSSWFLGHGVDFTRLVSRPCRLRDRESTIVDFVAAGVSMSFFRLCDSFFSSTDSFPIKMLYSTIKSFLEQAAIVEWSHSIFMSLLEILSPRLNSCLDDCCCPCSDEGCSPANIVLKSVPPTLVKHRYWHMAMFEEIRMSIVDFGSAENEMRYRLGLGASRLFLFETLGLTHTCCKITCASDPENGKVGQNLNINPRMSYEDAAEVHSIESDLAARLETWCKQAATEWRTLCDSSSPANFDGFIRGFIKARKRELRADEQLGAEYARSVRQAGIRLSTDGEHMSDSSDVSSDEECDIIEEAGENSKKKNTTEEVDEEP